MSAAVSVEREYLPATEAASVELVLLHGWGCNRDIWRALLPALRPWANITLLDLAGLAPGLGAAPVALDELLANVANAAPPSAVYLGWSLGGQLAMALAARRPEQVSAVITLCSSPRFTATTDWPGMPATSLAQFSRALADNPTTALRRFDSLQIAGAEDGRHLMRVVQGLRRGRSNGPLETGLQWLAQLDQRASWRELKQPQLHLLGERDQLLAADLGCALAELMKGNAGADVQVLMGASHLALLEQADEISARVQQFLERRGLQDQPPSMPPPLAKTDVALSFSKAASSYDSVASLQRDVGNALLPKLEGLDVQPRTILDLGSGTGYFCDELKQRFAQAEYIGLDLAEGMVRYAREHHPQGDAWLVGDAEALPLASNSVDLVFSSLALQWCHRTDLLFAELLRVLRPGGRCVFSTLGPQTLRELRASWAAVDQHQHVNHFVPAETLLQSVRSGEARLELLEQPYRMEYQKVGELLNELKTLGAHNVNRNRPTGLGNRRVLQGMIRAYEAWRENGILPASYQVYFGVLEKS